MGAILLPCCVTTTVTQVKSYIYRLNSSGRTVKAIGVPESSAPIGVRLWARTTLPHDLMFNLAPFRKSKVYNFCSEQMSRIVTEPRATLFAQHIGRDVFDWRALDPHTLISAAGEISRRSASCKCKTSEAEASLVLNCRD